MHEFFAHVAVRRAVAVGACSSMLITGGCATFTPTVQSSLINGGETRLLLTERGTLEMGTRIGPAVVAVDGRVRTVTDSSIVIALTQVLNRDGDTQVWTGEPLSVPVSYISGYRARHASAKRSLLLAAGLLTGAVAIALGFSAGSSGGGGRDQSGGTPR
jgi:hypothetical protein